MIWRCTSKKIKGGYLNKTSYGSLSLEEMRLEGNNVIKMIREEDRQVLKQVQFNRISDFGYNRRYNAGSKI